jgi:hypothetical protein
MREERRQMSSVSAHRTDSPEAAACHAVNLDQSRSISINLDQE